jgi:dienelactone hydrolase
MLFSVDTFQTGEARDPARKEEGFYFSTYNRTDAVQRVQDILTALSYLKAAWNPRKIVVVGQGIAGLWCLLARPFFSDPLAVAADVDGFDSESDEAYIQKLHVPLLRRAGDFQTAALLAADSPLLLHNLGQRFSSAGFTHAYSLHNSSQHLRISDRELSGAEIASWSMG